MSPKRFDCIGLNLLLIILIESNAIGLISGNGELVQDCNSTPSFENGNLLNLNKLIKKTYLLEYETPRSEGEFRRFVDNCIKTKDGIRFRKRLFEKINRNPWQTDRNYWLVDTDPESINKDSQQDDLDPRTPPQRSMSPAALKRMTTIIGQSYDDGYETNQKQRRMKFSLPTNFYSDRLISKDLILNSQQQNHHHRQDTSQ
ncbi:hypothetical protein SSS_01144 [Sarcoptes scabiei]|uniref:Uncharacterized protein n=1 Tax=Sarcoptes scabiei TaxID=52283 RepID=A0A834R9B9_SARSC|nr:hypothetical protein SSS_01144 [Sarcoptes scabiei]